MYMYAIHWIVTYSTGQRYMYANQNRRVVHLYALA